MQCLLVSILILLLLIVINALFVSAEIAIITSRKSRLVALGRKNNKGALKALELASRPEDFLSAVQVGITLINIIIGIHGGAAIADEVEKLISKIAFLQEYQGQISYAIVIVTVTYLTVLGEIMPKRIAMLYPEYIASITSYAMFFFTIISYPFVKSLAFSTKFFLTVLKIQDKKAKLSVEELKIMINQTEFTDMLAETEHDMLHRIINLSNTQVGAIMTPRSKVTWLDIKDSYQKNLKKIKKYKYYYFPLADGNLNNVIGIVPARIILDSSKPFSLEQSSETVYIPETARASKLIELFREKKTRIAIVVDEYGDVEGVVTLNDVLKILIGDLAIGMKDKTPDIIKHSENSYTVSGNVIIEEIMTLLNISSLPGDDSEDYRTFAGFILSQMKNLPKPGDTLHSMGWSFTIIKMEKRRIAKVLIKKDHSPDIK